MEKTSFDGRGRVRIEVKEDTKGQVGWLNKLIDIEEAKNQILFSLPLILTNIFYFSIPLVSSMFHYQKKAIQQWQNLFLNCKILFLNKIQQQILSVSKSDEKTGLAKFSKAFIESVSNLETHNSVANFSSKTLLIRSIDFTSLTLSKALSLVAFVAKSVSNQQ